MKTFNLFSAITITVLLLSACDTTSDYFGNIDKPFIKIKSSTSKDYVTAYKDTARIGNEMEVSIDYSKTCVLNYKCTSIESKDSIKLKNDAALLKFNSEGVRCIRFTVTDKAGREDEATYTLVTFENYLPQAIMKTELLAKREVIIDASSSFDADQKWGGKIKKYEYKVNNEVLTNSLNKIHYIFGKAGVKKIYLRVQDNNGAWSNTDSTSVEII